jgi:hypothetical protein
LRHVDDYGHPVDHGTLVIDRSSSTANACYVARADSDETVVALIKARVRTLRGWIQDE